jgi:hypothetical protein
VLEAVFILLEFPSPSRRIFSAPIHSPPLSGSPYWSFISVTTDEKIDAMIDAVKTTTIIMTTIGKS